jgi:ABC-type glycerol-3-phosphate transport system permease component
VRCDLRRALGSGGRRGVALFLLSLGTIARRSRLALGNSDIEFWIISNRIMPPIVAVLPIYVMFQQLGSSTRRSR